MKETEGLREGLVRVGGQLENAEDRVKHLTAADAWKFAMMQVIDFVTT